MEEFQKIKSIRQGFTLIELMIVIAIIGILAGVVLVTSNSGVEKSKKASAVTSMSSILPELVTCADDNGKAKNNAAPTGGSAGTTICCTTVDCTVNQPGHVEKWPDILSKTGYAYQKPTGTLAAGDYQFTATKTVNGTTDTITCKYSENGCS